MTTIIVKNADFSGGRLAHYSPPVAGATLCAFVGDADEATYLRNFGSGSDLVLTKGQPESVDAAFRRFSSANFLTTDTHRTTETTLMAVYRSVLPITQWSLILSSERDVSDGGRRGCGLVRSNNHDAEYTAAYGTTAANALHTVNNSLNVQDGAKFVVGSIWPNAASGARVQTQRMSAPRHTSNLATSMLATTHPADDEADYPLRIGHSYRNLNFANIDIGFVAVFPRLLTEDEKVAMYESVKRRFTTLGIAI